MRKLSCYEWKIGGAKDFSVYPECPVAGLSLELDIATLIAPKEATGPNSLLLQEDTTEGPGFFGGKIVKAPAEAAGGRSDLQRQLNLISHRGTH